MSNIQVFFPSVAVQKLKQKAKRLKKAEGIPHHEALNRVARESSVFELWHHVTQAAAESLPAELAYAEGLCIAMDIKDYLDNFALSESPFQEDFRLQPLIKNNYRKFLEESIDPDLGVKNIDCWSKEEIDEFALEDLEGFILLRYTGDVLPGNVLEALELVRQHSFWPPLYIWLKGQITNTYDYPATNSNGDIVGVRM